MGLLALFAAAALFGLLLLPDALRTGAPALIPLLSGVALAAGVAAFVRRWSDREGAWTDLHRLALVLGALPPMMLFGFLLVTAGNRVDQVGQGIACLVTLGLLTWFATREIYVGGLLVESPLARSRLRTRDTRPSGARGTDPSRQRRRA